MAEDTMTVTVPQWAQKLVATHNNISTSKNQNNIKKSNTNNKIKASDIPSPSGFSPYASKPIKLQTFNKNDKQVNQILISKAWQIAFQPAKSIPMNLIMSYMSGTSLQIIPIITAVMLITNPIKSILNINNAFKPVLQHESVKYDITGAMAVYVLCQLLLVGIAVYKLRSMALIPNTKSDWVAWENPTTYNGKSIVI
ncbi:related to ER membrane protein complex subunit 4 [Saccharomycodes ludwigii]|uniref:ER membrane protein complex subunit 4 n=1 Tax=Saccharomycodes ludwigii TaxID=36035 RepID=A0A376B3Y5_9ASCO|nr:hypothetical protein SCDLUD_002279 [Saccharomycodes ludwigii]KAH3900826.1 hypothetical protein SCDLUD_002279 [Saccharomycodes ludwigii]SSD59405.1 related to ER membrane protein complex subunit 4 [Saccharomycodes ludwigii]